MSSDNLYTYNGEIYNLEIKKDLLVEATYRRIWYRNNNTRLSDSVCVNKFIECWLLFSTSKKRSSFTEWSGWCKPLFYYQKNDLILFASELKSFQGILSLKRNLNAVTFLQYENVPTPHCIFKNCYKIKQGNYLKIDLNTKTKKEFQYWNVYDYYNKPNEDFLWRCYWKNKKILLSAFQYRMVADVPVAFF